jgi:16S rRNA C967 or C1407 C5-methylase (RsmB/RsmF family)
LEKVLPNKFLDSLAVIKGFEKAAFENVHYNSKPITSIRFNHNKQERFSASSKIEHPHFNLNEQVPWCEYGFYLSERPAVYIRSFIARRRILCCRKPAACFYGRHLSKPFARDSNIKILDLCAAPGGKTTLIASYFKNALIVSNEVIKTRTNILYENVTKWGPENVVVTNNDAADFKRLKNYFDLVVVDAPCSGSGLFRKDENAIEEWSESNVLLCSQRQQRNISRCV